MDIVKFNTVPDQYVAVSWVGWMLWNEQIKTGMQATSINNKDGAKEKNVVDLDLLKKNMV